MIKGKQYKPRKPKTMTQLQNEAKTAKRMNDMHTLEIIRQQMEHLIRSRKKN